MDLHRPMFDATMEKLSGVYPVRTSPTPAKSAMKRPVSADSRASSIAKGPPESDQALQADPEHWRSYATPASTPTGDHESSEQDDAIQVDISPEEPSIELSNWESFIHALKTDRKVSS